MIISLGIITLVFFIGSTGTNPFETLGAAASGGLGGGLGAAICAGLGVLFGSMLNLQKDKRSLLGWMGAGIGFFADKLLGGGISKGVSAIIPEQLTGMIVFGASLGALFGLAPMLISGQADRNFGAIAFWACLIAGGAFGVFGALPVSVILTLIGLARRSNNNPAR